MGVEFLFKFTFWQISVWFLGISLFFPFFYPIIIIWFITLGQKINHCAWHTSKSNQVRKSEFNILFQTYYLHNLWLTPVRSDMSMIPFCTLFIPHNLPSFSVCVYGLWQKWISLWLNIPVAIWFILFNSSFIIVFLFSLLLKVGQKSQLLFLDIQGFLKCDAISEYLLVFPPRILLLVRVKKMLFGELIFFNFQLMEFAYDWLCF